jgi:uncharacterized membrane protein YcjF (UPF0283 family)
LGDVGEELADVAIYLLGLVDVVYICWRHHRVVKSP